jgi:acyl transferase domain-containing protein/glutamate-1-semialdehyde aminotransferase
MAGRFPGANNIDELWRNLCAGVESITSFTDDALDPTIPAVLRSDPAYVKARGILDRELFFDPAFFGIPPREAELMDPQQRHFLETAWHALEHAGCVPERVGGRVGVYAGCHNNTYRDWAVAPRTDLVNRVGEFQAMVANEKDYLATRTAYALDLRGPAVSINTACSTSLVAVVQAVHALLSEQCDVALAGGATVICPQHSGYLAQDGAMLSPDGHCRPFDAAANGTVFSNGVGAVVLKRVDDAIRDGDTIYAIIRGAALNNDGARKMSFSAPAVDGQADVIARAQAMAGVAPETIGYIEAHGTATTLGDPIEIEALTQAFRAGTDRTQFCRLGSIKGNFGHLVSAAGVAGLIKAALALHHEQIPPTLHFREGNPHIDWQRSPFVVCDRLTAWPRGTQSRRAGVSSFGVGGTNAHVVLEEAPTTTPATETGEQLMLISARSDAALEEATANLATYLTASQAPWANIAFTSQLGRRDFTYRRFVVADDAATAARLLGTPQSRPVETHDCARSATGVAFLFPGQGTQYLGMGRELYVREPVFRAAADRCAAILAWNPLARDAKTVDPHQTRWAQPALFTLEYALARLWETWGLTPAAMLGHSVGEFVAACLAGVFSLEDGLRLVAHRAELMQAQPSGAMLSIRLPAERVRCWLEATSDVASINSPSLCVVSGPEDAIGRIAARCDREQVVHRRLLTSHAFHSPMMNAVVEPFTVVVRSMRLSPPQIPIISTVTGKVLTAEQATDPQYWAGHLRSTVRFADAVATLREDDASRVWLEIGPRATLATLARQQVARDQMVIASLEQSKDGAGERSAMLQAAGRLWLTGIKLNWPQLHTMPRRRVPLPAYPFQRVRCYCGRQEPGGRRQEAGVRNQEPGGRSQDSGVRRQAIMSSSKPCALEELRRLFEEASGIDLAGAATGQTFLELGLDSLFLTQAALSVQRKFQVPLAFRQLLEELNSLERLAEYIDEHRPVNTTPPSPVATIPARPVTPAANGASDEVCQLIAQQLDVMAKQLDLLQSTVGHAARPAAALGERLEVRGSGDAVASLAHPNGSTNAQMLSPCPADEPARPFGAQTRITKKRDGLTPRQRTALADITRRYVERTRRSKEKTQADRAVLADPRVVSGFRPETKEIVYPIVVERSAGCRLWDLDGNEYVDLTCGFGSNFLGYSAPMVVEAVSRQLQHGYEIGPQHSLAGTVAAKIARLTGMARVVLCNTGSEAVLGAVRLARTATGRQTVVMFNGAYHGINDEVIVRAGKQGRSIPAAAGIPPEAVANVLMLDYGTPVALRVIAERGPDLAAVLVEPVQSRHPDLQPRDFLHEVRRLTEQSGTALIFDEVITGFRLEKGGAQAYFGVRADLATYGKVVGGGLPIGVIAGRPHFMDGLDGGNWQYGDESIPEAGVTYFAGTFVRHPLALAAANAVLTHLDEAGPALYETLNARSGQLVRSLNELFVASGAPLHMESCASLMKLHFTSDVPYGELLYTLLRLHGVHAWDARPCFLTTAHCDDDVEHIIAAFRGATCEMAPFFGAGGPEAEAPQKMVQVPGARLGKDPSGRPAWYAPDPQRPGKYLKVGDVS